MQFHGIFCLQNYIFFNYIRLNETDPDYEKTIKNVFDETRDVWWHDAMKSASDDGK